MTRKNGRPVRLVRPVRLLTILPLLIVALSCGDDGGPKEQTRVTQVEADFLGGMAYFDLLDKLNSLHRFFPPTIILAPTPGCDPDESDPADTDTDGDGVLDDQTLTYTAANCTIIVARPGGDPSTVVSTGTVRTQDTDAGSTIFGFLVTYGNLRTVQTFSDGTTQQSVRNGFFAVDVRADGASSDEDLTDRYTSNVMAPGQTFDYSFRTEWTSTFAPDAPIDPASGSFPSGVGRIQGTFDFDGYLQNYRGPFGFDVSTTQDLAFDPICGAPFTAGQLRYGLRASGGKTGFTVEPQSSCSNFVTITAFDER